MFIPRPYTVCRGPLYILYKEPHTFSFSVQDSARADCLLNCQAITQIAFYIPADDPFSLKSVLHYIDKAGAEQSVEIAVSVKDNPGCAGLEIINTTFPTNLESVLDLKVYGAAEACLEAKTKFGIESIQYEVKRKALEDLIGENFAPAESFCPSFPQLYS